jgi:hypothetical protein
MSRFLTTQIRQKLRRLKSFQRATLIAAIAACLPSTGIAIAATPTTNPSTQPEPSVDGFAPQIVTVKVHARIDGSDVLTLKQNEAAWEHRTWGLPSDVSINNIKWDLSKTMKLVNSGATKYLPTEVDFQTCRVLSRSGRDVVAAEPIQGGLRIVFADAPAGADDYEIVIMLEGHQLHSGDGRAEVTRGVAHSAGSALLAAENTALRDLVASQRSQLAADAKTIAELRTTPAQSVGSRAPDAQAAQAGGGQAILGISGDGSKSSQKFTVAGDWDLNWSYDCRAVGGRGNFVVQVYNADGSPSFENTLVNQLGDTDSSVEHYHHGGTFYLVVTTLGSWKIDVKEPAQ